MYGTFGLIAHYQINCAVLLCHHCRLSVFPFLCFPQLAAVPISPAASAAPCGCGASASISSPSGAIFALAFCFASLSISFQHSYCPCIAETLLCYLWVPLGSDSLLLFAIFAVAHSPFSADIGDVMRAASFTQHVSRRCHYFWVSILAALVLLSTLVFGCARQAALLRCSLQLGHQPSNL